MDLDFWTILEQNLPSSIPFPLPKSFLIALEGGGEL